MNEARPTKTRFYRRRPVISGLFVFLTLVMVSFFAWREWRARSIPDVDAPFDVAAFLEENNDQKRASFAERFSQVQHMVDRLDKYKGIVTDVSSDKEPFGPEKRPPPNHIALLSALGSPDSEFPFMNALVSRSGSKLFIDEFPFEPDQAPHQFTFNSLGSFTRTINNACSNLMTRSEKLRQDGDTVAHLKMLRELLRLSADISRGPMACRLLADEIHRDISEPLRYCLSDRVLTAEDLQEIQSELTAAYDAYPSLESNLKYEYVLYQNELQREPAHAGLRPWLLNEPEVARRMLNLYFHNRFYPTDLSGFSAPVVTEKSLAERTEDSWLHQVYRNWRQTAPVDAMYCWYNIYENGPYAVEFTDHEDKPIIDSFVLAAAWSRDCSREHALDRFFHFDKQLNLVHLALQLYHRKEGKFPDRLEDLVPDYLARIPTNLKRKGDKLTFSPTAEDGWLFISDSEFQTQVLRPRSR